MYSANLIDIISAGKSRLRACLRMLCAVVVAAALLSLVGGKPLSAQSTSPAYWRYDAPGRLDFIVESDTDEDGIGDFLVVAGRTNLVVVGADGNALWREPYQSSEAIRIALAVRLQSASGLVTRIALATQGRLILLTSDGQELWRRPLGAEPVQLAELSVADSPNNAILVALDNGRLLRFNEQGQLTWELDATDFAGADTAPQLEVGDLNRDGRDEIVYSYYTDEGFGKVLLLDSSGERRWERSNSGRTTAMTLVEFDPAGPLEIAVATSNHRVYLYTDAGQRRWPYRSPNKAVTELTAVQLDQGPTLVVGTSAGNIIAYDSAGRRRWTGIYHPSATRAVQAISGRKLHSAVTSPVAMALVSNPEPNTSQPADVLLIGGDGRKLEPTFATVDQAGLSRLVDINRDGAPELLLAGFATLELVDPGIGARQFSESWIYRLAAEPRAALLGDIDRDGVDELLIGASDGKVHALRRDGTAFWTAELGGEISHLALADFGTDALPSIVVAHNTPPENQGDPRTAMGSVEVLRPDGRPIWSAPMQTTVSSLLVGDINRSGLPEILVGTSGGQVIALSLAGDEFWRNSLDASVNHIQLASGVRGSEIVAGSRANTITRLNNKGSGLIRVARYLKEIHTLFQPDAGSDTVPNFLVVVEDGTVRALDARGMQLWEVGLDGIPTAAVPGAGSLLVATDNQELIRISFDGTVLWKRAELGEMSALFWGDLDGDVRPDIAAGDRAGNIRLLTADGQDIWGQLRLGSELFQINAFGRASDQQAELIAVTDNGVVQLFTARANRPPLLINPELEVAQGTYNVGVTVVDVENDPVSVELDIFYPVLDRWISQGEKTASDGNDRLFWPVDPPEHATEVNFRFTYDDGTHQGQVRPAPGPAAILPNPLLSNGILLLAVATVVGFGLVLIMRQARSPVSRARRFRQRVRQRPDATLILLGEAFTEARGSPDFLLSLASKSRQEGDGQLANLADGLFLLAARPEAAGAIIVSVLEKAATSEPTWKEIDQWLRDFALGQALLTAPSLTELSLLRPKLEAASGGSPAGQQYLEGMAALLPVLSSLRDSERVELAEDRLVYLNEALGLLRQVQHRARSWQPHVQNALVVSIMERWIGQIRAEVEELQGRAQLVVRLKTKHLIPSDTTYVALEIRNLGRAPGENIMVAAVPSAEFHILSEPQLIPFLSPGRIRQVQFALEPPATDQFRAEFRLSYDDRHGPGKSQAFADMVHLLPRIRQFEPIANPYSPGTPLRRRSDVFFGREDLFDFIGQSISQAGERSVLILVGQRRTGKTSALLQLEHHLPDRFLSVYIDCQSLGVAPGMAALFHDIAWAIADSLAAQGHELAVPELSEWQDNPAWCFQRQFIPSVRAMLPEDSRILLIFDEFEALENLVADSILPPTLFTFLRHLMQHAKGLAFIFAGTRRLEEMGVDYWSVLFNIALYRHVGFLSEEAAKRVIREPVAPHVIYDDLATDKILRVTAGHPYFLQLVCYELVNRANRHRNAYITISDVNAGLDEMLRLGEVHFAYLWQRSARVEKALLVAAAHLVEGDAPFRPAELVRYLDQYSIHLDPAEITVALKRLVDREILRDISHGGMSLYELRIGLVGLWVAQNKSLSHLYESPEWLPIAR